MATNEDFINTERAVTRLVNQALFWTDNEKMRASLKRADYLIAEVRQASYFLTDPECTPYLKEEAAKRLVQAIINCK